MRWCFLFLALGAFSAHAEESRMLVMATGQCNDTLLSKALESMQTSLRERYGDKVLSTTELRGFLGAAPEYSLEEVRRRYQAARVVFDAARYEEAEAQALAVLTQVETLAPGPEPTRMTLELSALLALVYRAQGRTDAYDLMLRRILHLKPKYQLSTTETAPSVRKHFDALRERLDSAPKKPLTVRSMPEGAEVFIDGRSMGMTPVTLELPAAVYRLVLVQGGKTSFTRNLEFREPQSISVDMAFETLLDPRKTACLNTSTKDAVHWEAAIKLATTVRASDVVLLRLERNEVGADWLEATLLSMPQGRKVRAGGVKLTNEELLPAHLTELASFIQTGVSGPPVEAMKGVDAPFFKSPWHRWGGVVTGVAGAVAVGYGIQASMQANEAWSKYRTLRSDETLVAGTPEAALAVSFAQYAQASQNRATWLYIAGGAALVGGAVWWIFDKPASPTLSVAVTPGSVYGTFTWALPGSL